ncbi:sulfurtransferase [Pseudomonas simiae]|nr:sulfurtransferase [Pseudomonas simiae]
MVDHLIAFATAHYLLAGAFVILLALLIAHEMSRGGRSLSTSELTALVNKDEAVVVDIRPVKDFAAGHIVGALNIPQDKLIARLAELEKYKAKTIILVDAQGQHAGTHAREMLKTGFTAAKLSGGIGSWKADNLPLVK